MKAKKPDFVNEIAAEFRNTALVEGDDPVSTQLRAIERALLTSLAIRVSLVLALHGHTRHPTNFVEACNPEIK